MAILESSLVLGSRNEKYLNRGRNATTEAATRPMPTSMTAQIAVWQKRSISRLVSCI